MQQQKQQQHCSNSSQLLHAGAALLLGQHTACMRKTACTPTWVESQRTPAALFRMLLLCCCRRAAVGYQCVSCCHRHVTCLFEPDCCTEPSRASTHDQQVEPHLLPLLLLRLCCCFCCCCCCSGDQTASCCCCQAWLPLSEAAATAAAASACHCCCCSEQQHSECVEDPATITVDQPSKDAIRVMWNAMATDLDARVAASRSRPRQAGPEAQDQGCVVCTD